LEKAKIPPFSGPKLASGQLLEVRGRWGITVNKESKVYLSSCPFSRKQKPIRMLTSGLHFSEIG